MPTQKCDKPIHRSALTAGIALIPTKTTSSSFDLLNVSGRTGFLGPVLLNDGDVARCKTKSVEETS